MITAVLMIGGIGFFAAIILGISSVTFAVNMDPKEKEVMDQLPGANCGACGFAGCAAFAHELVSNPDAKMACPAATEDAVKAISDILERPLDGGGSLVAFVRCKGSMEDTQARYNYVGPKDCKAAQIIAGGSKGCIYGCLGLGSCVDACSFDALHMGVDGLPHVDKVNCVGCGECVDACPRDIIELVPKDSSCAVGCISKDKTKDMKAFCKVGCIKCGLCEDICPYDAIDLKAGPAVIDQARCRHCMLCVGVCPTGVIDMMHQVQKVEILAEKCTGCGICEQVCPVNAISGRIKEPYHVDPAACIGCGLCMAKCPAAAIERVIL